MLLSKARLVASLTDSRDLKLSGTCDELVHAHTLAMVLVSTAYASYVHLVL